MPPALKCLVCNADLPVAGHQAGQSVQCPHCGSFATLPTVFGTAGARSTKGQAPSSKRDPPKKAAPQPAGPPAETTEETAPVQAGREETSEPVTQESGSATVPSPEEFALAQRRAWLNPVGVGAFFCGGLAFLFASLSYLHYLSLPLSCLGLLLAAVGALTTFGPRKLLLLFPALGAALCLVTLLVVGFWPGLLRAYYPSPPTKAKIDKDKVVVVPKRSGDTPPGTPPPAEREATQPVDASKEAVRQGDARLRIASAVVDHVRFDRHPALAKYTEEKYLIIRFRVNNTGLKQLVEYDPSLAARGAVLTDDTNTTSRPIVFDREVRVTGQKQTKFILPPSKYVDDLLVFRAPPRETQSLRLTLTSSMFGGKGQLQLIIPSEMIAFR